MPVSSVILWKIDSDAAGPRVWFGIIAQGMYLPKRTAKKCHCCQSAGTDQTTQMLTDTLSPIDDRLSVKLRRANRIALSEQSKGLLGT